MAKSSANIYSVEQIQTLNSIHPVMPQHFRSTFDTGLISKTNLNIESKSLVQVDYTYTIK